MDHTQALRILLVVGVTCFAPTDAFAELCWDYDDGTFGNFTLAPGKCVQQGNHANSCSWNANCNNDLDPSDCCTLIPDPVNQVVNDLHKIWHDCFGSVGSASGVNPPGRGARWYAFHRQFDYDFNRYREANFGLPKIDSLEWCPGIVMPYGHFGCGLNFGDHPDNCGIGLNRPNNVACIDCEPFPQCLYLPNAGPAACPNAPDPICQTPSGAVSFPYTSLDQFPNIEEITSILDGYFHGEMHGDVGYADGSGYCADVTNPACSPRDPMFWRLHKALDDVVRSWQNVTPVDVMLVLDRSGSMGGAADGGGTKLQRAKDAAEMFADLLEDNTGGNPNRIGLASYSGSSSLNLGLTQVDPTLLTSGPFLPTLQGLVASGGTSIGSGMVEAVGDLCAGDCSTDIPTGVENGRKAILLLTDGKENQAPCLRTGCQFGSGSEIDYSKLEFTQLCTVGYGGAGSLDGELLTLISERQGGIYMHDTNQGTNLLDFFVKCFGTLSTEFVGLDPVGTMTRYDASSTTVTYESADDRKLTFVGGWNTDIVPGDVRLIVTDPSGALVQEIHLDVESSNKRRWSFQRIPLPHNGESQGAWRANLIRPHHAFANGFATDSFVDPDLGALIVRRQVQRLCPDGCASVLYFEDGRIGARSAYQDALNAAVAEGIVGSVTATADSTQFLALLNTPWDLIVYAHQNSNAAEPYDETLAAMLCKQGQRAILTDTRAAVKSEGTKGGARILRCADAKLGKTAPNWTSLSADGRLFDGQAQFFNPGYAVATFPLRAKRAQQVYATQVGAAAKNGGVIARVLPRNDVKDVELEWFMDVLVSGLSRLTPASPDIAWRTGDSLFPGVQILPSDLKSGGYPGAIAQVAVTRPTVGIGSLSLTAKLSRKDSTVSGDTISSRARALDQLSVPTITNTYTLNDAGLSGDQTAGNGLWSAKLPIIADKDGLYTLLYTFTYPSGGMNVRRELRQNLFVDVNVDAASSLLQTAFLGNFVAGGSKYAVTVIPKDALGNPWGQGRLPVPSCRPISDCQCDGGSVTDLGSGKYQIEVQTNSTIPIGACTMTAFGTSFKLGCGDGLIDPAEECDDGNANDADVCRNACTIARCGDFQVCSDAACTSGPGGAQEECDDGNEHDDDGCSGTCTIEP